MVGHFCLLIGEHLRGFIKCTYIGKVTVTNIILFVVIVVLVKVVKQNGNAQMTVATFGEEYGNAETVNVFALLF
ncbi:hypothetical protein FACS1894130_11380 [Spirochaetia bacterium]|nr:hypothetical protein FACS1894130_11380 [Spirochaetia bacterium]